MTLLQSLRPELWENGIRVTAVCPGFVDTPMITEEERTTLRGLVSATTQHANCEGHRARPAPKTGFPGGRRSKSRLAQLLRPDWPPGFSAAIPMEETDAEPKE